MTIEQELATRLGSIKAYLKHFTDKRDIGSSDAETLLQKHRARNKTCSHTHRVACLISAQRETLREYLAQEAEWKKSEKYRNPLVEASDAELLLFSRAAAVVSNKTREVMGTKSKLYHKVIHFMGINGSQRDPFIAFKHKNAYAYIDVSQLGSEKAGPLFDHLADPDWGWWIQNYGTPTIRNTFVKPRQIYAPNDIFPANKSEYDEATSCTFAGLTYFELRAAFRSPSAQGMKELCATNSRMKLQNYLCNRFSLNGPKLRSDQIDPWQEDSAWFCVLVMAETSRHPEWFLLACMAIDLAHSGYLDIPALLDGQCWGPWPSAAVKAFTAARTAVKGGDNNDARVIEAAVNNNGIWGEALKTNKRKNALRNCLTQCHDLLCLYRELDKKRHPAALTTVADVAGMLDRACQAVVG